MAIKVDNNKAEDVFFFLLISRLDVVLGGPFQILRFCFGNDAELFSYGVFFGGLFGTVETVDCQSSNTHN